MPTLSHRPPTLCRHRHSGRAYVKLDGVRHYLGKWNSKEAKAAYRAFIKQWEVTGAAPSDSRSAESIEVAEIAADYTEKSIGIYKPNPVTGEPSSELGVARLAMGAWIAEFGELPVLRFGPVCFQRLRAVWVNQKLAPETVSHYVRHIRRALKHAVALEKLPASVVTAIACVEPLKQAEHKHEPQPAPKLVIDETIKATIKHLPPMLADAVMLLRESGMRPCELCLMRPCDIDRSQREWEYKPQTHKTAHKGKVRIVQLGPACQRILKKYFATTAAEDYIFSPAIVMEQRRQAKAAARVTPLSCGNRRGSNVKRKPKRTPGKRYTTQALTRAIKNACEDNQIETWTAKALRKAHITEAVIAVSLQAASAAANHSSVKVTERNYSLAQRELAKQVARKIG